MTTITIETIYVECDECGEVEKHVVDPRCCGTYGEEEEWFFRSLVKKGWKFLPNKHLCPKCAEDYDEEPSGVR